MERLEAEQEAAEKKLADTKKSKEELAEKVKKFAKLDVPPPPIPRSLSSGFGGAAACCFCFLRSRFGTKTAAIAGPATLGAAAPFRLANRGGIACARMGRCVYESSGVSNGSVYMWCGAVLWCSHAAV